MHTIKLNKSTRTFKITQHSNFFKLRLLQPSIKLTQTGIRGPQGIQGPQGEQGEQGPPGTDANFIESFTNQSIVTVQHNLGKYPAVGVMDSAGDEVVGEVEFVDVNTVILRFANSFTGQAILN